jgi:hypothetical protein
MAEPDARLFVNNDLVRDGLAEARDSFIESRVDSVEAFLEASYLNGLELWRAHRTRVVADIDSHGGFGRVPRGAFLSEINSIVCSDGACIPIGDLFHAPLMPLVLDPMRPTFNTVRTEQQGFARLSFGGVLGIRATEGAYNMTNKSLFSTDVKPVLEGEIEPTQIAITEGVITRSCYDHEITLSGLMYTTIARPWGAKLRENFAPDPRKQPQQYAAWVASKPIPRLDLNFGASVEPIRRTRRYEMDYDRPDFGDDYNIPAHFQHTSIRRLDEVGMNKMLRYEELLKMLWKNEFGTDMPTSTGLTEQLAETSSAGQLSLPAAQV